MHKEQMAVVVDEHKEGGSIYHMEGKTIGHKCK